jgi:capsular polysaccharide transport system permease protein
MEGDRPDRDRGHSLDTVISQQSGGGREGREGRENRPRGWRARERQSLAGSQNQRAEHPDAEAEQGTNLARARERSTPPVRRIEQRLTVVPPRRELASDQYRGQYVLPAAPERKPPYGEIISFLVCVVLPIIAASVYYFLLASPQYIAEFRFTVKDALPMTTAPTAGLLGQVNVMSGAQDNYIVTDFLGSREAIDDLEKRIKVTQLYARPVADWWARYNRSQPIEKFVPYWQDMLTARFDQVTGIATAQVRAFTPEDALLIGNTLVAMSEELVNRIASRTTTDAVKFSQNEVTKAEERLRNARVKMMDFRNRTGVIDPQTSLTASNSSLTQSLRANLAQLETQLSTLQRQNLQMDTPVMVGLRNQISATKQQLQNIEATVGQSRDGVALSKVIGEFEQLELERQFAQNMVNATMQTLDVARANAAAQHLYITPYVRPSLPESSTYPRPLRSVIVVGILAFVFWICLLLMTRSVRERFA